MRKEALYVRIDKELLEQFRQHVLDKHGKLRGTLAIEIENALRRYMEKVEMHGNTNPGSVEGCTRLDRIIRWLKDRGYVRHFTIKDWELAVINTVGSDPRTIRKYLELALKLGRIRHVVGNIWEFT